MRRSSLPQRKPSKSAKADAGLRCRQHLQWVRGHVCTVCGTRGDEGNKIEAAHVRRAANSGVSIKPSADYETADREIRSHARAVCAAADFGCQVVKLATGDRLICDGRSVVTVLARHQGIYCLPGFVL